jgi:uncharacterized small protein (DUF1192 family)
MSLSEMTGLRDRILDALVEHALTEHGRHGQPAYTDPNTERIVRENAKSRAEVVVSVVADVQAEVERLRAELARRDDQREAAVGAYAQEREVARDMHADWAILVERTLLASAVLDEAEESEIEAVLAPVRTELLRKILAGEAGRDDLSTVLVPKLAEMERQRSEHIEAKLDAARAETKRLRDDLQARIDDQAMTAKFVGERLGLTYPLPAVTSIGCVMALDLYMDGEEFTELLKRVEQTQAELDLLRTERESDRK